MNDLTFIPAAECRRLLDVTNDRHDAVAIFGDACRLNALSMIALAGSGHIGSSFSSLDIVSWLQIVEMKRRAGTAIDDGDIYFSSKGHDAPGLYAVLAALGVIDESLIYKFRRIDGLPGHPDIATLPGVITNTGSLGMGISKAKGFVRADRLHGRKRGIFVLLGDGELQEGQIWESLGGAVREQMGEIIAIVDHNKIQSDTWVKDTADLGDIEAKFASFGWHVQRCDGHDLHALDAAITAARKDKRPSVIVADTVKAKGISFMELMGEIDGLPAYLFHSGAPSPQDYDRGIAELKGRIDKWLSAKGGAPLKVVSQSRNGAAPAAPTEGLIGAYAAALVKNMERNPNIVALDGDLAKDCGLWPARRLMPDRVVECGIAEQDMVSQAGAMALGGLLPIAHSFACFMTPRANEHMFNNATEGRKVIYAASLAGLVPGMPGHSHQMIRDISLVANLPNLIAVEPSCEAEVGPIVDLLLGPQTESAYLRFVSIRYPRLFPQPDGKVRVGHGAVLRQGKRAAIVAYGPVMLNEAWQAAERLAGQNIEVAVINMPWLNRFNAQWLATLDAWPVLMVVDNHSPVGGLGDQLAGALLSRPSGYRGTLAKAGVEGVAACGTNAEVLRYHGLSADDLAERLKKAL